MLRHMRRVTRHVSRVTGLVMYQIKKPAPKAMKDPILYAGSCEVGRPVQFVRRRTKE